MSESDDVAGPLEPNAETQSLRSSLEHMREQAARELERLNRRLVAREHAVEHTVASATERLALQQELTMLRQALGVKEQALDRITDECRRLEDLLEDRNLAYDGLQQEFDRRDISLKEAHDEVERLQQAMAELESRSAEVPHAPSPVRRSATAPPARRGRLWLTVGLLLFAAALAVWFEMNGTGGLGGLSMLRGAAEQFGSDSTPETRVGPEVGEVASGPPQGSEAIESVASSGPAPDRLPPTRRDRLRDGSLGPMMAELVGGTFDMGQSDLSGRDFVPMHAVDVSPFLIGVYEVTFAQYDRFVRATGRRSPSDFGWGRGTRPVVDVSWEDARDYASWLARQTGQRYRLPTEAEWEFAARAGGRGSYWWGFGLESGRAICFDCGSAWDNRSTAPVGSLAPSAFGLYDTAGNAMEWVADCYVAGYEDAPADGRARLDGDCRTRVARGGAFNKPAASMRTYVRARFVPETRLNMLGFRVARDP